MKTEQEIAGALDRHGDMVKRICLMHLKDEPDSEDIFQEVFLKYALRKEPFFNEEHEKAWFAQVTMNACRDLLRSFFHRNVAVTDQVPESGCADEPDTDRIFEIVKILPEKYRDVIYLYYYEEYPVSEIAQMIGKKESTVYTWLARGKKLLKDQIGGEWK